MKIRRPVRVTVSLKACIGNAYVSATLGCLLLVLLASVTTACSGIAGLTGQVRHTSDAQSTLAMKVVKNIQVCDKSGNVVIRTDASVEKITVKSQKAIYADNDTDKEKIASRLQELSVHVQDVSASSCDWLNQANDTDTLTVAATTPDDQDMGQLYRDRINLEILLPTTTVQQGGVALRIEGYDQIHITGIGGNLQLTSLSGDVLVENSFLSQASRLYTASGDLTFSGALLGQTSRHEFISDSGDVDLTFPGQTNATLDADAPSGSITSDFDLKNIKDTVAGESFSGELNPEAGSTPSIKLKIHAGDGSITIHKA